MFFTKTKIKWVIIFSLVLANIFVYFYFSSSNSRDYLTLAVLDIGQGDAILIEDKAGHQILIDGGPDQKILAELPKFMSVSDRSLDLLILSHPHADHLVGLVEILKRYEVAGVLEAGAVYDSAIYREWHRLLQEKNIPIILARRGEKIRLADAELDILAPFENWSGRSAKEIHDSMVVAQLLVASSSVAILTGDMEQDLEQRLLASEGNLQAKILKIGHHGSKTSSSENFVKKVAPEYAVISVAKKNRYGHPYPATLELLKKLGLEVLQTSEEGSIVFRTCSSGVCRL